MKWLFNKCRHYEAGVSLLAVGALAEQEEAAVKAHLAACAACRARFAELKALAGCGTKLGETLPAVEPSPALRWRWMKQVRQAASEETAHRLRAAPEAGARLGGRLATTRLAWLPGRRLAWGSLAAMWALILFFHFSAPDTPKAAVVASSPVTLREVLLALKTDRPDWPFRGQPESRPRRRSSPPAAAPPRTQRAPARLFDLEVA